MLLTCSYSTGMFLVLVLITTCMFQSTGYSYRPSSILSVCVCVCVCVCVLSITVDKIVYIYTSFQPYNILNIFLPNFTDKRNYTLLKLDTLHTVTLYILTCPQQLLVLEVVMEEASSSHCRWHSAGHRHGYHAGRWCR